MHRSIQSSNLLVQIQISLRHANFAKADHMDTKILMDNKYPTEPYLKGMALKGSLKKARNAPMTAFPKKLAVQIKRNYSDLAHSIKELNSEDNAH